mgnify:CR=1 FL=1
MVESTREFYEKYFVEQDFSAEEKYKQYTKVQTLKRFSELVHIKGFGMVVGVGKGADLIVAPDGVVALDLPFTYLPMVKKAFPHSHVVQGDGTLLSFTDNTFDYIVCSEVLEHVPERNKMLAEFARVLKPGGILIITTPNWINWYGIFRYLAQIFSRKKVHAGDQPIDNWTNVWSLKKELSPYFKIKKVRGWWYYPPIGRGKFQLFPKFFTVLWKILLPFERLCQVIFPWFGHSIFIAGSPKK